MFAEPFEGETGINATGFRQGGLRLFHLAFERISRGQTCVYPVLTISAAKCLLILVDRSFDMAGSDFCIAQLHLPRTHKRIART